MKIYSVVILFVLNGIFFIQASKILMVFPHFGKSHYFQGKALGKGLARAGHEVTMVSPFEDSDSDKQNGYKEIVLKGLLENLGIDTNFIGNSRTNPFLMIPGMIALSKQYSISTLTNPDFQKLLNSKQNFDVIILEDLFFIALRAVTCHFKAPLILFSPFAATSFILEVAGNPAPPSYLSNIFMGYSNNMTFWERSMNSLYQFFDFLSIYLFAYPMHNKIVKQHLPNCPTLEEIDKEVSVILLNNHESINAPSPAVPNMVNILGFHLKEKNILPPDLQQFMDNSREGVLLFSFGSFVHPSKMDPKIKTAFLKSLGKLKQNVLWKTDEDNVPDLPANVRLSKWLPQEDLLAHPNTKLFITHAGFVSAVETIYHAVPVLAVPLAGDQETNAARYLEMGVGLSIYLKEITEQKLDNLLTELLTNESYRNNAKIRSELLRDRPIKPMDLATYWVEYVIRHKGAKHLRVSGLELHWYQYILLDIIVVWSTVFLASLYLVYIVIKKLVKPCFKRKKVKFT